jgi:hypothetical protein
VSKAEMPVAASSARAVAYKGNVFVLGGKTNGQYRIGTCRFMTRHSWKTLAPMPQAVTDMSHVVLNRQLWCIGGGSSSGPVQGTPCDFAQIHTPSGALHVGRVDCFVAPLLAMTGLGRGVGSRRWAAGAPTLRIG